MHRSAVSLSVWLSVINWKTKSLIWCKIAFRRKWFDAFLSSRHDQIHVELHEGWKLCIETELSACVISYLSLVLSLRSQTVTRPESGVDRFTVAPKSTRDVTVTSHVVGVTVTVVLVAVSEQQTITHHTTDTCDITRRSTVISSLFVKFWLNQDQNI